MDEIQRTALHIFAYLDTHLNDTFLLRHKLILIHQRMVLLTRAIKCGICSPMGTRFHGRSAARAMSRRHRVSVSNLGDSLKLGIVTLQRQTLPCY